MIQTNKSLYLFYGLFCSQSSWEIVSADMVIGPRELLEVKSCKLLSFIFLSLSVVQLFSIQAIWGVHCSTLQRVQTVSRQMQCSLYCSEPRLLQRGTTVIWTETRWAERVNPTKYALMTWSKSVDCYLERPCVLNRFCPLCRINKNALCTWRRIN